jgi:hypothetical protein
MHAAYQILYPNNPKKQSQVNQEHNCKEELITKRKPESKINKESPALSLLLLLLHLPVKGKRSPKPWTTKSDKPDRLPILTNLNSETSLPTMPYDR